MNNSQFLQNIKEEYGVQAPTKLDELKKLDSKVKTPAFVSSMVIGVAGSLILGTGMCLAMKVIGDLFALGIVVGCAGIALCAANYFIYKAILKSRKRRYGAQILALSDELLNEGK